MPEGSDDALSYIVEHDDALAFARINRQLIALRIMQQIKANGNSVLDVAHNFVSACRIGDQQGWLHRKGATPDDNGLVIIPGSRGDYSGWFSPSGVRKHCIRWRMGLGVNGGAPSVKGVWQRNTQRRSSRTELGSRVICRDKQLIFEEAPQAYKSAESVVQCLVQAGLIIPVARLRPVLTLKTVEGKRMILLQLSSAQGRKNVARQ